MYNSLSEAIESAKQKLITKGVVVSPHTWQAIPMELGMRMREVFDFNLVAPILGTLEELVSQVKPDLPWADEHFEERVCGRPLNPAPSYIHWPYYKQDEKWRSGGKFSHTYPERIWPTCAEIEEIGKVNRGIRYRYGDLKDVIGLIHEQPLTRQAFLPIWFPEDTGAVQGQRVPCTIGYWFIHRESWIDLYYPIRSCDYRRHFRNDIYMACRLLIWVLEELRDRSAYWDKVNVGNLHMSIWNLHIFEGEQNFI